MGNGKLRPPAFQTDMHVGGRCHGWVAQGAWTVAIETDFSGDRGQGTNLALRADHIGTSTIRNSKWYKIVRSGGKSTVIGATIFPQGKRYKIGHLAENFFKYPQISFSPIKSHFNPMSQRGRLAPVVHGHCAPAFAQRGVSSLSARIRKDRARSMEQAVTNSAGVE